MPIKEDGVTYLPEYITAHLMRALFHVRHNPNDRLILQPPANPRAPVWNTPKADYDVIYRGQCVGHIWRFVHDDSPGFAWHWGIRAKDRKHESGHSLTRWEAMEQFRAAWDTLLPDAQAFGQ